MTRHALVSAITLAGLIAMPHAAGAQEVDAGWEGARFGGYAWATGITPVSRWGSHAWIAGVDAGYMYYRYQEDSAWTHVQSPGFAVLLGYRFENERWGGTLLGGYEVRRTLGVARIVPAPSAALRVPGNGRGPRRPRHPRRPNPPDPPAPPSDVEPSWVITERGRAAQGFFWFQSDSLTLLTGLFDYSAAVGYVWTRAGVRRQVTNRDFAGPVALSIGVEGTWVGTIYDRSYQGGAVVGLAFLHIGMGVDLRAGYTQRQYDPGPLEHDFYLAVGLWRAP